MFSEDLKIRRVPGRVRPDGDGCDWALFLFTPDSPESAPFHVRVSAGAEAFVLRGILAVQPEIPAIAEGIDGRPPVMLELAPHFAEEEEIPGQRQEHVTVPIRVRRIAFRPGEMAPALASNAPLRSINHHPVYCIFGEIIEPAGFLATAGVNDPRDSGRNPPVS